MNMKGVVVLKNVLTGSGVVLAMDGFRKVSADSSVWSSPTSFEYNIHNANTNNDAAITR